MTAKKRRKEKKGTKASGNYLMLYFNEIGRIPLLSRKEEEETARAAAAGDKAAREKLVNANLRFVVNVAKKYQGHGLPLEDLISEGNIGLVNAVDRYNVERGYHFISYAVWWIRQSILSALYEKSRMIRLPQNRAAELVRIEQARKIVQEQYSSKEEVVEIANLLNMDKSRITDLINISRDMLSLENPVSGDQDTPLVNYIEDNQYITPDQNIERNVMETGIEKILNTLEKDEAEIIRCHYGLGRRPAMSLQELGERYNLTKERIRQIELRAINRLQNPMRIKELLVYVA